MKKYLIILIMTAFLIPGSSTLYGGTSIDPIVGYDVTELEASLQDLAGLYGTSLTNAYALGNIAGYPIGSSYLGSAPHLYLGFSLNSGLTNMNRFDGAGDDVIPGFGFNPVVMFGLGLGKGLDILGKAFVYSSSMYKPPVDTSYVTLNKLNIYSFGAKLRYNIVKRKTLMPGVFHFEGITLSVGGDAMYGNFNLSGTYPYTFTGVDMGGGGGTEDVSGDVIYDATIKYFIASANLQALVYVNVFFLFNVYTGFGTAVNFGSFDYDITATSLLSGTASGADFATMNGTSNNKYKPKYVTPLYVLGIEVDLFILQLCLESMVDLTNGRDINISLGARSQW